MDPGEESFSLSSFDFSSSFGLYSSSDDERDKDGIDEYIELDLPPPPSAPTEVGASDDDKELEFRISFSAVAPFPGFHTSSINSANIVSSKLSFDDDVGEDANAQRTAANTYSSPPPVVESTLSHVDQRSVSIFPLAWTRFPSPAGDGDADDRRRMSDINSWKLVQSGKKRKTPAKINRATNVRIAKLLVKLRSMIISGLGSMRASLAQAGAASSPAQPNTRKVALMKPFDRWFALCKLSEPQQRTTTAVRSNGGSSNQMKFEAMRKLFGGAVSPLKNSEGSRNIRLNKSCPTSIKSSPIHQSGDTSLVHAAIAHCKKSFGQSDDFSF